MSPSKHLEKTLSDLSMDHDVLVIHSSIANFRIDNQKWVFLSALRHLIEQGKTLALPAFTFSFCKTGEFSKGMPSEVGILADWALELPEFKRTDHPIYSFAVAGPQRNSFLKAKSRTTFDDTSPFGVCEALNAAIIMLGCDWNFCTQFHRYEEIHKVPYRHYKCFQGATSKGGDLTAEMYVRDLEINAENDFQPLVESLKKQNGILAAKCSGGLIQKVGCNDLEKHAHDILAEDVYAFVKQKKVIEYKTKQKNIKEKTPSVKIALMGEANLSFLQKRLEERFKKSLLSQGTSVLASDFGQSIQDTLNPQSWLYKEDISLAFFVSNINDLVSAHCLDGVSRDKLEAAFDIYLQSLQTFQSQSDVPACVFLFEDFHVPVLGNFDSFNGNQDLVRRFNDKLIETFKDCSNIYFIDVALQSKSYQGSILDPRLWFIGRFPFSDSFTKFLADRLAGVYFSLSGKSTRLVVVDLDNTLWGGILGEDAKSGLAIGGDYPGNVFQNFQKVIKAYKDRGIALAICSKNDEEVALDAIRSLDSMVLCEDDFVCHRINWQPKWQNIVEIASELNLGLENVLFIDDNPAEREMVRQHLPQVKVIDLPKDPVEYTTALRSSLWLECMDLSKEDQTRVESYKKRKDITAQKNNFKTQDDFYASLKPRLYFSPLEESNKKRAFQLVHKTNQFNTTTIRYSLKELEAMVTPKASLYVIGVQDKLFDFENLGIIILRWNEQAANSVTIDSFLMSCRVLGRGLEKAIIEHMKDMAKANGASRIYAKINVTERNTPAQEIYQKAGFSFNKKTATWVFTLQDKTYTPDWVRVIKPYKQEDEQRYGS